MTRRSLRRRALHRPLARVRRPRSLRTRLTAVLLALAAVGLVALSAITWGSQRRFLQQQIDDRAKSAVRFISGQVVVKNRYEAATGSSGGTSSTDPFEAGPTGPGETTGPSASSGPDGGATTPGSGTTGDGGQRATTPGGDGDLRASGGPPPAGGADGGRGDLPPGTYGELRTASGTRIGSAYVLRTLGGEILPVPVLPTTIEYDRPLTVRAVSGSTKYRVVASRSPFV
ncbi:MAG: hypothetical protein QM679_06345, partial [Patulibacter sp.]